MLSFIIKQKLKPLNKRFEPANEIYMLPFIIKQKLKPLNKRFEPANEIYMLPFIIKQKLKPLNGLNQRTKYTCCHLLSNKS